MKKIIMGLVAAVLMVSAASAKVFDNADTIVENFYTSGSYIKIVKDKNNICYYSKSAISGLNVDEDDMEVAISGYNPFTGKNGDSTSFNVKRWNISSDDEGNIIITKK